MKMIYKFTAFLVLFVFLFSCGSGRINNLDRNPDEAIVIAKMKMKDKRENFTTESAILFDERWWGTYAVHPDKFSYIYLKLPLGKHYISRVSRGNSNQNLPENLITFDTPESKIYYIGDITMLFDMDYNYGAFFGLIGAIAYETRRVRTPLIHVQDNYDTVKSYFTKLFPTDETIYKSIAVPDSSFIIHNIKSFENEEYVLQPDSLSKSYKRRKMK